MPRPTIGKTAQIILADELHEYLEQVRKHNKLKKRSQAGRLVILRAAELGLGLDTRQELPQNERIARTIKAADAA